MRRDRLYWPYRARFARDLVADREHEIQWRRVGPCEFVPALAAQPARFVVQFVEKLKRHRIHCARRMTAGAEGLELALAPSIHRAFGHDAARGISGAQEQHV